MCYSDSIFQSTSVYLHVWTWWLVQASVGGVNWQIPLWRNTFRLHLALIGSLSGLRWLVLNSPPCIPSCSGGLYVLIPTPFHPNTLHVVLAEILQLKSSCSMPVFPRGYASKGGWLSGFGGNAQCWLHVNRYRVGQGRASSSPWIMTCSNEHENSPNWLHLSHIRPNKQPFVSSSASLPSPPPGADLIASSQPFSGLVAIQRRDNTRPIQSRWRCRMSQFLAALNNKQCYP